MSQNDPFRIDLNTDGVNDTGPEAWADMMNEFEEWDKKQPAAKPAAEPAKAAETAAVPAAPVATKPAPAASPTGVNETPAPDKPLTRYEELCRTPSMNMAAEDLTLMTDFSEIMAKFSEIGTLVERLRTEHPDFVVERFTNLWASNMKEASQVMMREFHAMRNGRQQKKYDRRNICRVCTSVFMLPLPGGICDECRASTAPRQKAE